MSPLPHDSPDENSLPPLSRHCAQPALSVDSLIKMAPLSWSYFHYTGKESEAQTCAQDKWL